MFVFSFGDLGGSNMFLINRVPIARLAVALGAMNNWQFIACHNDAGDFPDGFSLSRERLRLALILFDGALIHRHWS